MPPLTVNRVLIRRVNLDSLRVAGRPVIVSPTTPAPQKAGRSSWAEHTQAIRRSPLTAPTPLAQSIAGWLNAAKALLEESAR